MASCIPMLCIVVFVFCRVCCVLCVVVFCCVLFHSMFYRMRHGFVFASNARTIACTAFSGSLGAVTDAGR